MRTNSSVPASRHSSSPWLVGAVLLTLTGCSGGSEAEPTAVGGGDACGQGQCGATGGSGTGGMGTPGTGGMGSGGTNTGGTGQSAGGTGAGGSGMGGAVTGGTNAGGSSTGGVGAGGMQTGGTSTTGGQNAGGAGTGGQSTGGTGIGGQATGGAGTGGLGTSGQSTGGAGIGGQGTGAVDTGGTGTGGVGTGGANTGGVGTGGTSTGGTSGAGSCSDGSSPKGFNVANGKLRDVHCGEFILRGINYPYAWYATRNTQQDFQAIANTGANVVRVVLATGARWTKTDGPTVTSIINAAKANQLVAVLEVHDTTGWSEQDKSVDLTNATNYWTSQDVKSALTGQEAYVIINIGNEPMGNDKTSEWGTRHVTAITALRNAGLSHTLMVDAPNWGQDWSNTMRDGDATTQIWNADPDHNIVFSVHMYDSYDDFTKVTTYFNNFLDRSPKMPLVVGEFAADHQGKNVDEDAIMQLAETLGVGYMGWSWSGNSSDLATLDITNNFNASSLTTWGNRLINGTDGLKSTASVCGVFE